MPKIKKRTPIEYLIYSMIIVVGIILDQLTKFLTVYFLKTPGTTQPVIQDVVHFTYYQNTGAAFGMLKDQRWVFMFISTVMIVGLSAYLFLGMAENMMYAVPVAMIISGGIGNMIDRIFLGYVVDFMDFRIINFAIFNFADSIVCVGAGLLILALILDIIKDAKKTHEN